MAVYSRCRFYGLDLSQYATFSCRLVVPTGVFQYRRESVASQHPLLRHQKADNSSALRYIALARVFQVSFVERAVVSDLLCRGSERDTFAAGRTLVDP